MNRFVNLFAIIGKIAVVMAVLFVVGLVVNLVIMPLYTRQKQEIRVPDIRGLTYQFAALELMEAGFKVVVDDRRCDMHVPTDVILDQLPPANAVTKKGRRIHVSVSIGKPFITVPRVVGQSKEDAIFMLQNLGLKPGTVKYMFSNQFFEGLIIKQSPDSGKTIAKDDNVHLVVSLGEKPTLFIVPSLLNLPEQQAKYLILKAGLVVGTVTYDIYKKRAPGVVVVQQPAAGSTVAENDTVNLIINKE